MKMVRLGRIITDADKVREHRSELKKVYGHGGDTEFIPNINPSGINFWYPGKYKIEVNTEKKKKMDGGRSVSLPNIPKKAFKSDIVIANH